MKTELIEQELGDLLEAIIDHRGRTPKKLGGDFAAQGIPVISAKNIKNSRLNLDGSVRFVDPAMWDRWMPVKLRAGDVLMTSEAPLGETAYLSDPQPLCLGQRLFALRPDSDKLHSRYLFYALRGPTVRGRILARASGTTAQGIRQAELLRVPVPVPPVAEQKRIAAVLAALDDKIESNRRLASTVEQILAAHFRARFVNFAGRDDLVDSDIGPIPRGWSVEEIGKVLRVVGGSTPSTKDPKFWDGGAHCWATPKDLSGLDEPIILDTARHITDTGVSQISSGLLPPGTVLMSSRAPVGYTAISFVPVAVNQGFIAVPPSDDVPSEYTLFWMRENMERIRANAGGTTFAEISKRAFRPLLMLVPPKVELDSYRSVAGPLIARIAAAMRENALLASVRDAVLPRLTSGALHVSSAIEILSEPA